MKLITASGLLFLAACSAGNKVAYVNTFGIEVFYATDCESPSFSTDGSLTTYSCV